MSIGNKIQNKSIKHSVEYLVIRIASQAILISQTKEKMHSKLYQKRKLCNNDQVYFIPYQMLLMVTWAQAQLLKHVQNVIWKSYSIHDDYFCTIPMQLIVIAGDIPILTT